MALLAELSAGIEQKDFHTISFVGKHTSHGQGVTAIVARSGKDLYDKGSAPAASNGSDELLGCSFHQVDGLDGLVIDGILVQFF